MAADKEAVGLSRVHMHESKCILPVVDGCKQSDGELSEALHIANEYIGTP